MIGAVTLSDSSGEEVASFDIGGEATKAKNTSVVTGNSGRFSDKSRSNTSNTMYTNPGGEDYSAENRERLADEYTPKDNDEDSEGSENGPNKTGVKFNESSMLITVMKTGLAVTSAAICMSGGCSTAVVIGGIWMAADAITGSSSLALFLNHIGGVDEGFARDMAAITELVGGFGLLANSSVKLVKTVNTYRRTTEPMKGVNATEMMFTTTTFTTEAATYGNDSYSNVKRIRGGR